ncbi:MAG: hypothetical protein K2N63_02225, partial [Lachnospiraceae bacterium]|nr:hypothetical protein [Lachnospiraceae bacterium]
MENQYEKMSLAELRIVAKEKGVIGVTTKKKHELADLLKRMAESEAMGERKENYQEADRGSDRRGADMQEQQTASDAVQPQKSVQEPNTERKSTYTAENAERKPGHTPEKIVRRGGPRGPYGGYPKTRPRNQPAERSQNNPYTNQYNSGETVQDARENAPLSFVQPQNMQPSMPYRQGQPLTSEELEQLDSGETKEGILEIMPEGFGFIRCDNFLPGANDVYVSPMQIRKMNLKTGDMIVGNTKIRSQTEKFSPLLYVNTIND